MLSAELDYNPRLQFAVQQNDVPVVRRLRLVNLSDERLEDLHVRLTLDPPVGEPWETRIAAVDADATYNLGPIHLELSAERLATQTEREAGRLLIDVSRNGTDALHETRPVEVLAYNEWSGSHSLPELLAAFVLPNHPSLASVLKAASRILADQTGDPTFDAYQTGDRQRALHQIAAVYAAVVGLDITYVNPPASFEIEGQKVRTPDQVARERLGTCLDITLFASALLDRIGLNPVLVLTEGHAFPGVWLSDWHLPEPSTDNPLPLKKRVELDEAVVFDSSAMARGVPFDRAVEMARRHLDDPGCFVVCVDVRASRLARIRPLPMRVDGRAWESSDAAHEPSPALAPEAALPELDLRRPELPGPAEEAPPDRLERWRSRLLDLSLRNRLLNFRETGRTLRILSPSASFFEDVIASDDWLTLEHRPARLGSGDPRDPARHLAQTGESPADAYARQALGEQRVTADLDEAEFRRRSVSLYRSARASLRESGAITLYLAIGFLEWFESESSEKPRRAPLLLLPAELRRPSAREPFQLRVADDEPLINHTLLEKLKRDFGYRTAGLEVIPAEDAGWDVPLILKRFRQLVLDTKRWRVVDECWLAEFSFTKFLMWRDLTANLEALQENPLVSHLLERSGTPYPLVRDFTPPARLDKDRTAGEALCVVDADSSQLAAVFGADDGNSFVLQGPPGTGKSQTITNLVAQCLGNGKSVLFVSEKRAALEVVHRRLTQVGLDPFCLELHSHKASKRSVVRQLGEPFRLGEEQSSDDWRRHADSLQGQRELLNRYVERLHRPGPFGESLFEAVSQLIGLEAAPRCALDFGSEAPTQPDLEERLAALADLAREADDVGLAANHPWIGVGQTHHTPRWQRDVEDALDQLRLGLERVEAAARAVVEALDLPRRPLDRNVIEWLTELADLLLTTPRPRLEMLVDPGWDDDKRRLEACLRHGESRAAGWAKLSPHYQDGLLELDVDGLHARFARWARVFFLVAFVMLFTARRALSPVVRGRLGRNRAVAGQLETARQVRERDLLLESVGPEVEASLGDLWQGPETDWPALRERVEWTDRFRRLWRQPLAIDDDAQSALRERIAGLAVEGADEIVPERGLGHSLAALSEAAEAWQRARDTVVERLSLDAETAWGEGQIIADMSERLATWRQTLPRLREWCDFARAASQAEALDLTPIVAAVAAGDLEPDEIQPAFQRALCEWWVEEELEGEQWLADFRGRTHEEKIGTFRRLDAHSLILARRLVRARLASRLPNYQAPGEMAKVRHLLNLKTPRTPIRKLFGEIRHAIGRLKPCLLMSPLSIAQYLDPNLEPFDVVVFDEASQIPPWDALGAIARGRQVIVVGDAKQLPPTTFFQRSGDDESAADDDDLQELESILDECDAAGLSNHPLRWHYRSRHESLIAFSNFHYYGNNLHTFPAAAAQVPDLGVKLRPVPDGFYDRGGSATNRAEAEAVVAEVVHRLTTPGLVDKSVGIVTFSLRQQRLIEDLLDEARRDHPAIEPCFDEGREEPVFVKSLESVQGDERDIMLFSIGYGPDRLGRVMMNFGPLNREGGERRLNVAITRARELLLVFSTLRPEQIDLSRTRARGVQDLKTFLDFAARGPAAIDEAVSTSALGAFDSPFERSVAQALETAGWEVHRRVGCAGYRVNLAILDPEVSGRYLLGIECDGAAYQSARSARDRDRTRQAVLEQLGWRLLRIWSLDWLHARPRETTRLLEAVSRAARHARAEDAATTIIGYAEVTKVVDEPPSELAYEDTQPRIQAPRPWDREVTFPKLEAAVLSPPKLDESDDGAPATEPDLYVAPDETEAPEEIDEPRIESQAAPIVAPAPVPESAPELLLEPAREPLPAPNGILRPAHAEAYRLTNFEALGGAEAFDRPSSDDAIADRFRKVLMREAPLHVREACRRVADCWGVPRLTKRVRARVLDSARHLPTQWQPVRRGDFLWLGQQDRKRWRAIRLPDAESKRPRKAEHLPPEEVANAAEWIVQQAIAITREDLIRATSDLFRFGRVGTKVRQAMESGIEQLLRDERCLVDSDRILLPD